MRDHDRYIIGMVREGDRPFYYCAGFGFGPYWTGRSLANGYGSKKEALAQARRLGPSAYVTLRHWPVGGPDPVVTAPARKATRKAVKPQPCMCRDHDCVVCRETPGVRLTNNPTQAPGGALPVGHIEWVVDRHHVGESYLTVARDLSRRMRGWPKAARRAALGVAFRRHAANRQTYVAVMTGSC